MNTPEQVQSDIALLTEAIESLKKGPCRFEQMVPAIYAIYRRHGFDPQEDNPSRVLRRLRKDYA
jgi:hypothetical protein